MYNKHLLQPYNNLVKSLSRKIVNIYTKHEGRPFVCIIYVRTQLKCTTFYEKMIGHYCTINITLLND